MPALTPVIIPPLVMLAIFDEVLDQIPLKVEEEKVVLLPIQTSELPVISPIIGIGKTVTVVSLVDEHPFSVTV